MSNRRFPITITVRTVGLSLLGLMMIPPFTGIYSWNDMMNQFDSYRSTDSLIREQKEVLRTKAETAREMGCCEKRLENELGRQQQRCRQLEMKCAESSQELASIQRAMACCTENTVVLGGNACTLAQAEFRCRQLERRVTDFGAQLTSIRSSIAGTRKQLEDLRVARSDLRGTLIAGMSRVQNWEAQLLVNTCRDGVEIEDLILADSRSDDIIDELARRGIETDFGPSGEPDWDNWSLQSLDRSFSAIPQTANAAGQNSILVDPHHR